MSDYQIKDLSQLSIEQLYQVHADAFSDYPFHWSKEAFERLLIRRGFAPALSFGAFIGDHPVAFTMNGIRPFQGALTAYDCSTGTVPEHRTRGLASKIFEHSLPYLRNVGVKQYVLEVLEDNTTALSVYRKQNFQVSRKFECYAGPASALKHQAVPEGIQTRQVNTDSLPIAESWADFPLSWQNSLHSIQAASEHMQFLMAYADQTPVALGAIETISGDIPFLAVDPVHRRKGIGSSLLSELKQWNTSTELRIVNVQDDQSCSIGFAKASGIPFRVSQLEMIKPL